MRSSSRTRRDHSPVDSSIAPSYQRYGGRGRSPPPSMRSPPSQSSSIHHSNDGVKRASYGSQSPPSRYSRHSAYPRSPSPPRRERERDRDGGRGRSPPFYSSSRKRYSPSRSPKRDRMGGYRGRSPISSPPHSRYACSPRRISRSRSRSPHYSSRRYSRSRSPYRTSNRRYGKFGGGYSPIRRGFPPRRRPGVVERGSENERLQTKIMFVGSIPYEFCERDLTELFERCGKLTKVSVPIDKFTGKNKGFAFVEFEERCDAEDAMEKYQGFQVEDRRLKLDWDIGIDRKTHLKPRVSMDNNRGELDGENGAGQAMRIEKSSRISNHSPHSDRSPTNSSPRFPQ